MLLYPLTAFKLFFKGSKDLLSRQYAVSLALVKSKALPDTVVISFLASSQNLCPAGFFVVLLS